MQLLSPEQVAQHLGLTVRAVHELSRAGKIAYVQLSARKRAFKPEHVSEFIKQCTIHVPKTVDNGAVYQLPSPRKGGEHEKSGRDITRAQIREELRLWH